MNDNFDLVLHEVDLILAEVRVLRSAGPYFRILHRFREPGRSCGPGEEIAAVFFIHRGQPIGVRIPLALRLLFDYLAKHGRLPQSAGQIAAGMHADAFYRRHGDNAVSDKTLHRRVSKSSIKEYIKRIRDALQTCFEDAKLRVRPDHVLVSVETVGNEVGYRLKGTCEWFHLDDLE